MGCAAPYDKRGKVNGKAFVISVNKRQGPMESAEYNVHE